MVQRYDAIQAANWQMKLGAPGEVVTEIEDIGQCIHIIVTTRRGAIPHRPLFGTLVFDWLDAPLSVAGPSIVREVFEGVQLWEPRAVVESVTPLALENGVEIEIAWRPAAGGASQRTSVNL